MKAGNCILLLWVPHRARIPDVLEPAAFRDHRFCLTCHDGTYERAVSPEHGRDWTPVAPVDGDRVSRERDCVTRHDIHAYRKASRE